MKNKVKTLLLILATGMLVPACGETTSSTVTPSESSSITSVASTTTSVDATSTTSSTSSVSSATSSSESISSASESVATSSSINQEETAHSITIDTINEVKVEIVNNITSAKVGEEITFAVSLKDNGFKIDAVKVNDVKVEADKSGNYSFTMPNVDVVIKVEATAKSFKVTTKLENATIAEGAITSAKYKETVSFTPMVQTNYQITKVRAYYETVLESDGGDDGVDSSETGSYVSAIDIKLVKDELGTYSFTMPAQEVTIQISAESMTQVYIDVESPSECTVQYSLSTGLKKEIGDSITFTAHVYDNETEDSTNQAYQYAIDKMLVGGHVIEPNDDGSYTFVISSEHVNANKRVVIQAQVKKISYDISVVNTAGHVSVKVQDANNSNITKASAYQTVYVSYDSTTDENYGLRGIKVTSGANELSVKKIDSTHFSFVMEKANASIEVIESDNTAFVGNPIVGTFKGWEIYNGRTRNSNSEVTVAADGLVEGSCVGDNITAIMEVGDGNYTIQLSNGRSKPAYLLGDIFVTQATSANGDLLILVRSGENFSISDYTIELVANSNQSILLAKISKNDTLVGTVFVNNEEVKLGYEMNLTAGTSFTSQDAVIEVKDGDSVVTVVNYVNNVLTIRGYEYGTFTGEQGDVTFDGYSQVTIGETTASYSILEGKYVAEIDGSKYEFTLDLINRTYVLEIKTIDNPILGHTYKGNYNDSYGDQTYCQLVLNSDGTGTFYPCSWWTRTVYSSSFADGVLTCSIQNLSGIPQDFTFTYDSTNNTLTMNEHFSASGYPTKGTVMSFVK